jgi:deoxyribose-phosphate aldolase
LELTAASIAAMIDLSAVQARDDESRIRELAARAQEIRCAVATCLPVYTPLLLELLTEAPEVGVSGNVGFPSGGHTRETKVAETRQLVAMGCREIDMVVSVGRLIGGDLAYVENEIRAVVEAAEGRPVKVILECHHLDDEQIRRGCDATVRAGAAFIKTGTGWTLTGATVARVALIRRCVGDGVAIKASGGIRDLDGLLALYRAGARRFGIGLGKERLILEQAGDGVGGEVEA